MGSARWRTVELPVRGQQNCPVGLYSQVMLCGNGGGSGPSKRQVLGGHPRGCAAVAQMGCSTKRSRQHESVVKLTLGHLWHTLHDIHICPRRGVLCSDGCLMGSVPPGGGI